MPATRGPRLLLLLAWAGLTAAAHESIILKMAEGEFTVQSGEDLGQPVGERLRRLRLPQGADVGAELVRLRSLKSVEWAHPDMPIRSAAVNVDDSAPIPTRLPDNPRGYKQQWGMQRIGMPAAWAVATGAASKDSAVRLCLVDSGVDVMHPDLAGNVLAGFNAVNGEDAGNFNDLWGHGTEVSGVIAGSGANGGAVGVNWNNINLLVCRFMDATGYGSTSDAVQCLDWCVQQNASIISASWTSGVLDNPPLQEAVARTEEAGALMVVSAGNQGLNMKRAKLYPQAYAAKHDNMLVVGATDMFDNHVSYSNFDTKIVHLSAPGDYVFTTKRGGGFVYASGTSIAAPFASSSAALLLAVARDRLNKTLSAQELKQMLMDSAEVLPGLKGRSVTGGRLRTDWALQRLLGQPLSPKTKCLERPGSNKCEKERQAAEAEQRQLEEEQRRKEEEARQKAEEEKRRQEEEEARKAAEAEAAAKAEAEAAMEKATAESMTEAAPEAAPSPSPAPAAQPTPAPQPAPSPQPTPPTSTNQTEAAPAAAVQPAPAGGEQVPAAGAEGTQPVAAPTFTVVIHGPALEFPGNRKAPALADDPPVAPKPRGPSDGRPVPRSALEVRRVMLQDGVAELPAGHGMPAVQLRSPLEGLTVEEKAARIFGRRAQL